MRYLLLLFLVVTLIVADVVEDDDQQGIEGSVDSAVDGQSLPVLVERADEETEADESSSSTQYRIKRARGGSKNGGGGKEHTKNARPSTLEKHQKGQTRQGTDQKGGEKGDARRRYRK